MASTRYQGSFHRSDEAPALCIEFLVSATVEAMAVHVPNKRFAYDIEGFVSEHASLSVKHALHIRGETGVRAAILAASAFDDSRSQAWC
jgi:hypothetical protein